LIVTFNALDATALGAVKQIIVFYNQNYPPTGRFAVQALKKVNFAAAFEAIPKNLPNANVSSPVVHLT
jgi:hypothetical protein